MTDAPTNNTVLPLLADPANYVACPWDLTTDEAKRAYWLDLFRRHFPSLLAEAVRETVEAGGSETRASERAERAKQVFFAWLDERADDPAGASPDGRMDILTICHVRERVLRDVGIHDPYRLAKATENATAMRLLPGVLAKVDAMSPARREEAVLEGVFAGNIFDLGATKTAERFQSGPVDFYETLNELKPRPWLVDDLDAWLARMDGPAHRRALLFVDNAGPDVVLGMLPFARHLLARGTEVILAANTAPSLNDVTHEELVALLDEAAHLDTALASARRSGRLQTVASGNGAPLIDMTRLSPQLVAWVEAEPVDLLVIEGMGRALESNFDARFTCDTLKLAMVKDQGVADALGGEVYDLVCRFERGEEK
ncbi:MAG: ARMT1-like domain-containing protein [Phycisphaeraceae bacterium]